MCFALLPRAVILSCIFCLACLGRVTAQDRSKVCAGDVMQRRINCGGCLRQKVSTQVSKNLAVLYREEVESGLLVPPCISCLLYPGLL